MVARRGIDCFLGSVQLRIDFRTPHNIRFVANKMHSIVTKSTSCSARNPTPLFNESITKRIGRTKGPHSTPFHYQMLSPHDIAPNPECLGCWLNQISVAYNLGNAKCLCTSHTLTYDGFCVFGLFVGTWDRPN